MGNNIREFISLSEANRLIDNALEEAKKENFAVTAVVVDTSGILIALKRMDDCLIGPIEVAIKKARTAALFGFNSSDFGKIAQPGQAIYSIEHTNGGLISFGGGATLIRNGKVIGGLGVSGATVEGDESIAQHTVLQFNK